MDFTKIKSLTIPEGNVKSISRNGIVIWGGGSVEPPTPPSPTYTDQLSNSQAIDSIEKYNGVGYKTGYYLTSSGTFESYSGKANEWMTGCIPYTIDKPIYIKGVGFTTASHDRMYFFSSKTTRVAPAINSGATNLGTYFTVEQLGDKYYKLTPISGSGLPSTAQYVRMSFTTGTPSDVIITIDEEIS
jgi:hypothetical protein